MMVRILSLRAYFISLLNLPYVVSFVPEATIITPPTTLFVFCSSHTCLNLIYTNVPCSDDTSITFIQASYTIKTFYFNEILHV